MKRLTVLVLVLIGSFSPLPAQEPVAEGTTRVYLIGNSLTDELKYDDWVALSKEGGITVEYARKMIPGASLIWHKDHPKDGFIVPKFGYPEDAFKNFQWNALTLQPFRPGESEAALHYANAFWEGSPEGRVYVYAQWPSRLGEDWENRWIEWRDTQYTPVLQALRGTERGSQVFLIPVGQAMDRLHRKAQLGLVPGIRSAWDLYSDGVHVNNIGSYLVATTFYATLFGKSPVGLPVGAYQGKMGTDADYLEISPELARIIQETAWEAVTGEPASGVLAGTPPVVTTSGLSSAPENEPFRSSLEAAFGQPPYTWSVAGGALPSGIALTADGTLQGTPTAKGRSSFTAQATDSAGSVATRELSLEVVSDEAPKVVTATLPELAQGAFIDLWLEATGGNGAPNWSVSEGSLPSGLVLERGGRLYGSPGGEGSYAFTVKVSDSDGGQPESDTKAFSGTIAAADLSRVVLVRQAAAAPKVDGVLDPAEGWQLDHGLKKRFAGESDNTTGFDLQWFGNTLYVAVEVEDPDIVTEEGWGKAHHTMDAVAFYFDGLNNREDTYNFDDRRIVIGPTQQGNDDRNFNIVPFSAAGFQARRTEKGYILEGKFDLTKIGAARQTEDRAKKDQAYAGAVIGFDIVNHDLDIKDGDQTRTGWQGSDANPENSSAFGTIILQP